MTVLTRRGPETVFVTENHDPAGVGAAREAIATWLARHDASDEVRDTILLVASELVTNAMCNTAGVVRVTIGEVLGGFKLQVTDEAIDLPTPRVAAPDATSGRGLAIVAALAHAWGAHQTSSDDHLGKVVWATCRRR